MRIIAIIDEKRIVRIKGVNRFSFKIFNFEIAFAAPVLDFPMTSKVMNEIAIIRVFIEPNIIRNCSLFNFPVISEPIIAA